MDDLDRQVLARLVKDGRATYASVGQEVGLSLAATKRRVDRLVQRGTIRGFTAVVDPRTLGWAIEAQIAITTRGTVPFETMRADLLAIPEVVEAFTVAGVADSVLRVVAEDPAHLERLISRLRGLAYVEQTDTMLYLSPLVTRR